MCNQNAAPVSTVRVRNNPWNAESRGIAEYFVTEYVDTTWDSAMACL